MGLISTSTCASDNPSSRNQSASGQQTPGGGATFVVELPAAPAAFPGPGGLHTLTGPDVGNGVSSSVPGVIEVAGVPGATGLEE